MREWKDYDGQFLDYDELKKREQQRLEYIQSKRAADDAAIDAKKHKAMKIFSSIAAVIAVVSIVYAISSYFFSDSFIIPNTKGHVFSMDLSGAVAGIEVVPGSEQSVAPVMTNTGTENAYVFIRFDVSTYIPSSDVQGEQEMPVYSFTPDEPDLWTQIETDNPGQLLYAYGTETELNVVAPKEDVVLAGTLTMMNDNAAFVDLSDDDVKVKVTGCGIGTDNESEVAYEAYQHYVSLGGE